MMKVENSMWKYMKVVLKRDHIKYRYDKKNGELFADISADRFEEAFEDALCEKQRAESFSKLPVLSLRTLKDDKKLYRLTKNNGAFVVLEKDVDAAVHEFCW